MDNRTSGSVRQGRRPDSTDLLARGLGWFSIALGLAEVVAPRALARSLGMEGNERLLRAYGMREIATGVGILSNQDPTPWIWGRVGGDALDMATLATGLEGANPKRANVGLALAAVAGVTALDVLCAQKLSANGGQLQRPPRDYGDRRGMPRPPEDMRGVARDFPIPRDMRTPPTMRPYTSA